MGFRSFVWQATPNACPPGASCASRIEVDAGGMISHQLGGVLRTGQLAGTDLLELVGS